MKYLFLILLLSGCAVQTEVRTDAIHPEILNRERAVVVDLNPQPDSVGHVETNISVQPDALHVEPIHVPISGTILKDAFHIEPISISGKVDSGAVQIPINFSVPEGAMKINFSIAEGAISIRGAEAGAVQTKIEVPIWSYITMGILGIGWLITKFRRHTHTPEIRSMRDVLF